MPVDREMVARTVSELRAALPDTGDLLAGLLRVAEATRTMLKVDGAGVTLVHEGGPPRWVAATDAAMELLEQVQHDLGEDPYLQADQARHRAALNRARVAAERDRLAAAGDGAADERDRVADEQERTAGQPD